jgi:plastocyanin
MTKPLTPEELDEIEKQLSWCQPRYGDFDNLTVKRLSTALRAAWQERREWGVPHEEVASMMEDTMNSNYKAGRAAALEEAAQAFEPLRESVEAGQVIAWDSRRLVAHVIDTIRALKDPK